MLKRGVDSIMIKLELYQSKNGNAHLSTLFLHLKRNNSVHCPDMFAIRLNTLTTLILFRMKSFKSLLVRELQRELGYRKIEYNSKDRKAQLQEVSTH